MQSLLRNLSLNKHPTGSPTSNNVSPIPSPPPPPPQQQQRTLSAPPPPKSLPKPSLPSQWPIRKPSSPQTPTLSRPQLSPVPTRIHGLRALHASRKSVERTRQYPLRGPYRPESRVQELRLRRCALRNLNGETAHDLAYTAAASCGVSEHTSKHNIRQSPQRNNNNSW